MLKRSENQWRALEQTQVFEPHAGLTVDAARASKCASSQTASRASPAVNISSGLFEPLPTLDSASDMGSGSSPATFALLGQRA